MARQGVEEFLYKFRIVNRSKPDGATNVVAVAAELAVPIHRWAVRQRELEVGSIFGQGGLA